MATKTTKPKTRAADEPVPDQTLPGDLEQDLGETMPDLGEAAAEEGDYASPPVAEWPADDRPAEEQPGTPAHLGDEQPYAGPKDE